jgi:MFS family permease
LFALWWVMFALGVLASVMLPPAIALTAELSSPGTRGSAMGGFNLAGSLGFAIGPLAGAWALERGGFGIVFLLGGLLEIATAVFALVWIVRSKRREARRPAAASELEARRER